MRGALRMLARDLARLSGTAVGAVVLAGMIAVPALYAWLNVAGSWDPYGNTANVLVAVANLDEGYEGGLVPVRVNLGERVVSDLSRSDSIGYVGVSAERAEEGVRSGEYYAAIIIPEDFSRDLLTSVSDDPRQARIRFVQNEKANPIASIVTDKASAAVKADIDREFAESVASVGVGALDELGRSLDDGELGRLASGLDGALSDSADSLSQAAADLRSLSELLDSTQSLVGGGEGAPGLALGSLAPASDAAAALREDASGVGDAAGALDGAAASVDDALDQAAGGVDGVQGALDAAWDTASGQADQVGEALDDAAAAVSSMAAPLDDLSARLGEQDRLMQDLLDRLDPDGEAYGRVEAIRRDLAGLRDRVDAAAGELHDLEGGLAAAKGDLEQGASDADAAKAELDRMVADARQAVADARASYDGSAAESLRELAGQVSQAADQLDSTQESLSEAVSAATSAQADAGASLAEARSAVDEAAQAAEDASAEVAATRDRLRAALASGDAGQVRAVLAADPSALATFVAEPVRVERTAVFPAASNGSAMAPFYTTLAIWIGAVVLCALVRAVPTEGNRREAGCSPAQAYLGRLLAFAAVGLAQAALVWAGNLALGVQCAHPALFLLTCLASSLVYVGVVFTLAATLGDVGKAVAVVLMVVQVAGSGGTFPPEMLPAPFRLAYAWLPFVHSEGAMRAALFGVWGADLWLELARLAAFLVPALALGLALSRPAARLGAWFEGRLEETRLM